MATFYIKSGDTSPVLQQTLKDASGAVINLTGASVRFHLNTRRDASVIDDSATIDDAVNGVVSYTLSAPLSAGNYLSEFEVTYSDGSIETFPNSGYTNVIAEVDLA